MNKIPLPVAVAVVILAVAVLAYSIMRNLSSQPTPTKPPTAPDPMRKAQEIMRQRAMRMRGGNIGTPSAMPLANPGNVPQNPPH